MVKAWLPTQLAAAGHGTARAQRCTRRRLRASTSLVGAPNTEPDVVDIGKVVRTELPEANIGVLRHQPGERQAPWPIAVCVQPPAVRRERPTLLHRIASWLRPGGLLIANMGAKWNPGSFEADWLRARAYFSGYDVDTHRALMQAPGLDIVTGREATHWETIDNQTRSVRFFWVSAQRPGHS